MPRISIDIVGGAYTSRSAYYNPQTCKNLYTALDATGAKAGKALFGTPGLTSFSDLEGSAVGVRGMHVRGAYIYAVVGSTVYRVDTDGNKEALAASMVSSTGYVWMSDNGTEVMITDGIDGYYIDSSSVLNRITDADFPAYPISVTFQDGYFIVVNGGTGNFYLSPSFDASGDWDATDFSTTWRNSDNLMGGIAHQGELWLLGERSVEIYYNSGAAFPYERSVGAHIARGCVATDSIATSGKSVLWLSENGEVLMSEGYAAIRMSTDHIAYIISSYSVVSDAIAWTYIQEGHEFYFLTFPTANATWVLDITTTALQGGIPAWHQRLTGSNRHQASCYVLFPSQVNTGSALVDDDCADDDTGDWTIRSAAGLLLHCNGADQSTAFPDSSVTNHTVTANVTAQVDTAQSKWGGASLLLDGDSDTLTTPDSTDWDILTATDVTIDFWVKHADHAGAEWYIGQREDANNRWYIHHVDGAGMKFDVESDAITNFDTTAAGEITNTNWHHVAMCKVGNIYGLYLDGTQIGYATSAETDTFAGELTVGDNGNSGSYFDGNIDEIRIVKDNFFGADPNDTPDDTITAPTAESASALAFDTDHYELTTDQDNDVCYVDSLSFNAGKFYKISMDLKDGTATPTDVRMYFYDGVAQYGFDENLTGTSKTYTHIFKAATTTATGRLGIQAQTSLAGNNIEFKNVTGYEVLTGKNKDIVGDRADSQLYELDMDKYSDNGTEIAAERTFAPIHKDGRMVFFHSLQIDFEVGVGNADDTDPVATLDWSDDGTQSWSTGITMPLGQAAQNEIRVIWRRLGKSRSRIFRVKVADKVKRVIMGAWADIEVGAY